MRDQFGREIDYMRLSITDRCNLRCTYCMPGGVQAAGREEILSYEEFLRAAQAAVALGITRFKVTGGEPLVRKGAAGFIARLKALPGVAAVTLTTNGVLLAPLAAQLAAAGIDGVNISLDAADRESYRAIAGFDALEDVLAGLEACLAAGIRTKLNCVLLAGSEGRIVSLARLAQDHPVDVRFIEVMPIGAGDAAAGVPQARARALLAREWPDLHPVDERRGFGPARYEASAALKGRIGWIDAVSHGFCAGCNRVRLTSTGLLKPCLCYGEGLDVHALLRSGASPEALSRAMAAAVFQKPRAHCFGREAGISEHHLMGQIGG